MQADTPSSLNHHVTIRGSPRRDKQHESAAFEYFFVKPFGARLRDYSCAVIAAPFRPMGHNRDEVSKPQRKKLLEKLRQRFKRYPHKRPALEA
jgi:hypothetical protein